MSLSKKEMTSTNNLQNWSAYYNFLLLSLCIWPCKILEHFTYANRLLKDFHWKRMLLKDALWFKLVRGNTFCSNKDPFAFYASISIFLWMHCLFTQIFSYAQNSKWSFTFLQADLAEPVTAESKFMWVMYLTMTFFNVFSA